MARGKVYVRLPSGAKFLGRTDLRGYGPVRAGEEFTVRELWPFGRCGIMEGGRKLRVRVVRALEGRPRILVVDVLADLRPTPATQKGIFDDS